MAWRSCMNEAISIFDKCFAINHIIHLNVLIFTTKYFKYRRTFINAYRKEIFEMATLYFYTETRRKKTTKIFRLAFFSSCRRFFVLAMFCYQCHQINHFFRRGQFCVGLHKSMDHMRQIRLAIKSLYTN